MAKKPSKKTAKAPKKSGGAMEADSNDEKTGLKLGTVVTLVSFHDEENESLRYGAKANADMCSVLEAFFGVEKSAWDNFADLPTNNEEPYRRFPGGLQPYRDWKAAVVVGDKVEVRKSDCWYEGIVRNIIPGFSQWSGPRYEVCPSSPAAGGRSRAIVTRRRSRRRALLSVTGATSSRPESASRRSATTTPGR